MKILVPSWINRDPLFALIAALSLAGLFPYVYFDVHELIRHRRSSLIDERYTVARAAVPASESIIDTPLICPLLRRRGQTPFAGPVRSCAACFARG